MTSIYRKEYLRGINSFTGAKSRCMGKCHGQYKNYGGRGIKFLLTKQDIERLWFRDEAYKLNWASLDRVDNDGDYEYNNCRFIEKSENTRRRFNKHTVII